LWLNQILARRAALDQASTCADMGAATIGGANAAALAHGEQRDLPVFAPGGVVWQPAPGDTLLILRGGSGGLEQCVAAADTAANAPPSMAPGELFLYAASGASIYLRSDGSIQVNGSLSCQNLDVLGSLSARNGLSVQGNASFSGHVDINGSLSVNGEPYRPCACP